MPLRMVDPTVMVNGQFVVGLHGEAVGSLLWMALPAKGLLLLSLASYPDQGFRLAGAVRGREIWFENGNDRYQIRLSEPLARSDGEWNLYVRVEKSYSAKQASFGAVNRLQEVPR
jgi:hypothetical protein